MRRCPKRPRPCGRRVSAVLAALPNLARVLTHTTARGPVVLVVGRKRFLFGKPRLTTRSYGRLVWHATNAPFAIAACGFTDGRLAER